MHLCECKADEQLLEVLFNTCNSNLLLSLLTIHVVGPGYIKFHIISNSKPFPLDLPLGHLLLAVMKGGVEILPVTSCYRNWDKLWPDEPLG